MPKKPTPKNFHAKCPHCSGTGKIPDPKVQGPMMKQERTDADATQIQVATLMKLSPNYICDLESGNRRWTDDLVKSYRNALKSLKSKPTK